jgi:hypothetical protein
MLTRDDLDEAVAQGIVNRDQADRLAAFADARVHGLRQAAGRDERFAFMRNFNELFIAIGTALVGVALFNAMVSLDTLAWLFFANPLIIWGIAEYLTARLRLTLPSIVLAILFVVFVEFAALSIIVGSLRQAFDLGTNPFVIGIPAILAAGIAAVSATLFYWRFRLPFALLLVAGALTVMLVAGANTYLGAVAADGGKLRSIATLAAGLASFIAAMAYDASDRERLSRRADCAFWLHLIAGPLIVHSIVGQWWQGSGLTSISAGVILVAVAVFALLALTIDRRAMLVSSLVYLGSAIAWGFEWAGSGDTWLFATLLVLGTGVVTLGVGWQGARRLVLGFLPRFLLDRLPPARSRAARRQGAAA